MSRFRVIKNSFLGGQISRDAVGRTDLPQYAHSCEILQNMIPQLSGGAYRRPGTLYWDQIPANAASIGGDLVVGNYQSSPPRVIPFIVSQQESFALVLGTMRWALNQSAGVNPNSQLGGGYLIPYRGLANSNSAPVAGMVQYGVLPYRCKSLTAAHTGTYECIYTRQGGPGAVANSGSVPGPTTILDVADSLQSYDDDVWAIQYCQANDVMFLTHPDYQPQVVGLVSGVPEPLPYDSGLTNLPLAQSRPYLNQNTTTATMKYTYSGGGGTGTLTCSVPFFKALHGPRIACLPEGSTPTDGAFFALAVAEGSTVASGGGILFLQVTSVTSSTVCQVATINGIPGGYSSATTVTAWWESAWSNYRGWPRACGIYQQRLCLAGTIHQPNALWFTATSSYGAPNSQLQTFSKFTALGDTAVKGATGVLANGQNYTTPQDWVYYPVDDSQGDGQSTGPLGGQPFRVSLATTTLDAIQYLSPDQQLFIGTNVQEWVGAPENGSFDVANSTFTVQSHYGSDLIQAVRIGYELMFILQKKDEVRAYQYNYFDQSFFGEPVQLFFDEYPSAEVDDSGGTHPNLNTGRRKYRSVDWDSTRSTLWCVDTAGNFFGLTRDRKLSVTTWHTHQMGGFNASHGQEQNITDNLTAPNFYMDSSNFTCDGSVVSACSVPNPSSGIRDLWMLIKRSVGNNTIYTVERMIGANTVRNSAYSSIAPGTAQEPMYVDCALFLDNSKLDPTTLVYKLPAVLDGTAVRGTYYSQDWGIFGLDSEAVLVPTNPVSVYGTGTLSGELPPDFNTSDDSWVIVAGAPYFPIIQPVRPDMPSQIGTSQGAIKRPSKLYVRVFKSMMFQAGSPPKGNVPAKVENVKFTPSKQLAQSPEIYTGDKEVFLTAGFDRAGYVYLTQNDPLPLTLVSLAIEGEEYEQ